MVAVIADELRQPSSSVKAENSYPDSECLFHGSRFLLQREQSGAACDAKLDHGNLTQALLDCLFRRSHHTQKVRRSF
jgi:hypothetical protein